MPTDVRDAIHYEGDIIAARGVYSSMLIHM